MAENMEQDRLTIRAAAERLNVTRERLMRYVQGGRIPVERPGWQYFILVKDLETIRATLESARKKA